jgi:L-ascorbate metabolism protein UlaG (beta-lactamase superfamily)
MTIKGSTLQHFQGRLLLRGMVVVLLLLSVAISGCKQHEATRKEPANTEVKGKEADSIEVTYIGNEGFLISMPGTKLLIDALQSTKYYDSIPAGLRGKMNMAESPFDGVAYLLVTHPHKDHFDPSMVAAYLANNPQVKLIAGKDTWDTLQGRGYLLKNPGESIDLKLGETRTIREGGTSITAIRLKHSGEQKVSNLAYLIESGGCSILHTGDAVLWLNDQYLTGSVWDSLHLTILFTEYFGTNKSYVDFIRNNLRPRHLVFMHIRKDRIAETKQEASVVFKDATIFERQMEKMVFYQYDLGKKQ